MSFHQTLRVMQLSALLLLGCALQVAATGVSQTITYSGRDVRLEKVFQAVKEQTGFLVVYNTQQVSRAKPVTVSAEATPLATFLDEVLDGQALDYLIEASTIFIRQKKTDTKSVDEETPPITVKGKVVNEVGEPVEGVTVMIKGTATGTVTNALGEFEIGEVPEKATLVFTSTAIEKLELKVNSRTNLTVGIKRKVNPLDEVQIIAYGKTTPRFNIGNVSTVKSKDIEQRPVGNPLLALQGRVPGLEIVQTSGVPGSGVTVRIRGQNSISNGNDPLFIIDGVPYQSQLLPNIGSILGLSGSNVSGSPFTYINPSDIQSIDVLKDAEATAIYGSRGANGVILITTKQGRSGRTNVDVNAYSGVGKITKKVQWLNTAQYLEMRHEAFKNEGSVPQPWDYDINGVWDSARFTDWQKELIGGTAKYNNIQFSIYGGTEHTQFRLGGTYNKTTTVFPGDFADKKGSVSMSFTHTSPNGKFKVQFSANYLTDDNGLLTSDLTGYISLPPNAPAIYNPDGSLNWAVHDGSPTWENPFAKRLWKFKNQGQNLVSNVIIGYQLMQGLNIKSSFGFNSLQINQVTMFPLASIAPAQRPFAQRAANYADNKSNTWIIEPQLSYEKNIGNGKIEALLGTTFQKAENDGLIMHGSGYNSDVAMEDLRAASKITVGSTTVSTYKYDALFGRLGYNWQDKYLLNLSVRRDGTSRFGPEKRFHDFAAISGGWIFSNEKWVKKFTNILSFGKLRGSYGTTGNDGIGDYRYMDLYTTDNSYQGVPGLTINNLFNPDLAWELTKKFEAGIELGLFRDRLLVTVSHYLNRSSNQLVGYFLPLVTGFRSVDANQPATVQNTGFEFLVNTVNINSTDFRWSTSINFSVNKNKLVSIDSASTIDKRRVGHPLMHAFVYHSLGVDPATGVYLFADEEGKPTFIPSEESKYMLALAPKFFGGFQNSFRYKGIQLDLMFQFVKQIGQNTALGVAPGIFGYNQPTTVLNRWRNPGDITHIQRFDPNYALYESYTYATSSDATYTDASYIRLKNVVLSFQLPIKWQREVYLQNCRIYLQCENLLTITKYKGPDPENQSLTSLPPLRVITAGVQVTF